MNQLGLYNLVQDIFSQKSPEAIADETRHGNRSTFVRLPVDTLTNKGISLDVEGITETTLLDIIAPTFIDEEINEQSLNRLVVQMKTLIKAEVQKRQVGWDATKYVQVFDLLCAGSIEIEIAKKLRISRERVRQVKEKLKKLQCVKKFYKELKGDYRGLKW